MGCGQPLQPEAQFCAGCGRPVGGSPPPLATPGGPSLATPAGPTLTATLGLEGCRNFLLQHQLISGGRNYRILNQEKRHLFTVKESLGQELRANFLGGGGQQGSGFHLGGIALGTRTFAWAVLDSTGNQAGGITIQVRGFNAVSTLADSTGAPVLSVNVDRGMVGGLTATAAFPDGHAMFQARGNLMRHNFSIHEPSGQEVAKIHEAWASVRDTYNLDLVGNVDPLSVLIFAILIDREKESN